MEQDRDISQILMNIRGTTGNVIGVSLISAKMTFKLITFLMRLAKKGMVAAGMADTFKIFIKDTEGKYTVYNIPMPEERIGKLKELNELELKLENAKNPVEKTKLRNEIKKMQKEIPELEQLQKLNIHHCVLPKLNGSEQTIQIAVDKTNDQMFKNWFLNHLTTQLSGGEKKLEELKVFTEGNFTIFNLPFEGEELKAAQTDFEVLGMNYAVLPDLKVGDKNSQVAVANADRGKVETWFNMWKEQQLRDGKETGEMYAMDNESYIATANMEAEDYIQNSEKKYRQANEEFEKQSESVPWQAAMNKENSEEYVRFLQDKNFEKITINKDTLVDEMGISEKAAEMKRNGYFISRIPGTYKENEKTLILPINNVFSTDDGKTYVAFIPKNEKIMVADSKGNISKQNFQETYAAYDTVKRSLKKVESMRKGIEPLKEAAKTVPIKAAVPKVPKL